MSFFSVMTHNSSVLFWFKHNMFLSKHCTKNHIFFPNVLKRWSFQKYHTGTWFFLYYQERWYFFLPKIWSYSLDRKLKMIFLKKYREKWYFLQIFWKNGLSKKKIALEHDLSCIIWKGGIFFTRKYDIFSLDGKWKISFLKVIDILDWHSRNSSSDCLHFYGDLHRLFYILLSSEKKQTT